MKIDAHCHTDCSDGNITIEERIALVCDVGYDAATITDHDFISQEQVDRAQAAAGEMPFIPGIELSLTHKGEVVHLLGYYVDPNHPLLQAHIQKVQEVDRACTIKLLEALRPKGFTLNVEDLRSSSLHTYYSLRLIKRVARDLFNYDRTRTLNAFLDLMRELNLPYADFAPWPVREAIDLIHTAGGFAVLAHPGGEEEPVMRALNFLRHQGHDIRQYVDWGLDGIEVASPAHTDREKEVYTTLAREYGLLTTAGSDCHGDDPFLGEALMGVFTDIPDDLYDRMLDYHLSMKDHDVSV
jgi:predicted metal-dependent phosphoesterase TrpH